MSELEDKVSNFNRSGAVDHFQQSQLKGILMSLFDVRCEDVHESRLESQLDGLPGEGSGICLPRNDGISTSASKHREESCQDIRSSISAQSMDVVT